MIFTKRVIFGGNGENEENRSACTKIWHKQNNYFYILLNITKVYLVLSIVVLQ